MKNPNNTVATEPFSLIHIRTQAHAIHSMVQKNQDYLAGSPGLVERHQSTLASAKSILRMIAHEDRHGEFIKIEGRVAGIASFLLNKTVGNGTDTVHGLHTWYWLGLEEYADDPEVQMVAAHAVATTGRTFAQNQVDSLNRWIQLNGVTQNPDGLPTPPLPEAFDATTFNPARLFTTLETEHDPAAALLRVGFRTLGAPAVLETFPPNNKDGLIIPDTEMLLAVDTAPIQA